MKGEQEARGRSRVSPHLRLQPLTVRTPRVTASTVDDDDVVVITGDAIAPPRTHRRPLEHPSACLHPRNTRVSATTRLLTAHPHLTMVVTTTSGNGGVGVVVLTAIAPLRPSRWAYRRPISLPCLVSTLHRLCLPTMRATGHLAH